VRKKKGYYHRNENQKKKRSVSFPPRGRRGKKPRKRESSQTRIQKYIEEKGEKRGNTPYLPTASVKERKEIVVRESIRAI